MLFWWLHKQTDQFFHPPPPTPPPVILNCSKKPKINTHPSTWVCVYLGMTAEGADQQDQWWVKHPPVFMPWSNCWPCYIECDGWGELEEILEMRRVEGGGWEGGEMVQCKRMEKAKMKSLEWRLSILNRRTCSVFIYLFTYPVRRWGHMQAVARLIISKYWWWMTVMLPLALQTHPLFLSSLVGLKS